MIDDRVAPGSADRVAPGEARTCHPAPRTLVYLHGLNSSPRSVKAQQLEARLAAIPDAPRYLVPALPHRPARAIAEVQAQLAHLDPSTLTLVGSSLGGYYATWLAERHGCRAALINPTTDPAVDLAAFVGAQRNLYTGERWELTRDHLDELAALRVPAITRPGRYFLLVETGDEVLDWRLSAAFYAGAYQYLRGGGSHGFEDFPNQIAAILRFAGAGAA